MSLPPACSPAILIIHVFQNGRYEPYWKYNFFTFWPRNMYNTTFLTKMTTINLFPVLIFNLDIATVHKFKMAATTQPLKYISEKKQV